MLDNCDTNEAKETGGRLIELPEKMKKYATVEMDDMYYFIGVEINYENTELLRSYLTSKCFYYDNNKNIKYYGKYKINKNGKTTIKKNKPKKTKKKKEK